MLDELDVEGGALTAAVKQNQEFQIVLKIINSFEFRSNFAFEIFSVF